MSPGSRSPIYGPPDKRPFDVEESELMAGGPTIRLDGGPGHGQIHFEEEFRDRIRAAQRMHRTEPDAAG
jgi:hypothetical protein